MKISSVEDLPIMGVKIITFEKFADNRGYFTETYRYHDLAKYFNINVVQVNESFSCKRVIRGLHLQWKPFMGKLVRVLQGQIIDLVLDIRKNSPTYGNIIGYELQSSNSAQTGNMQTAQWIWVPPGMAHGIIALQDTTIEYLCTGEYSQGNEASISPFAKDLNWSLCSKKIKDIMKSDDFIISTKDQLGLTLEQWQESIGHTKFVFGEC
jgi:dTDP-4-dehydrorhamnose 3,5-epimerase